MAVREIRTATTKTAPSNLPSVSSMEGNGKGTANRLSKAEWSKGLGWLFI
jgi:hypothetical protein